MLTEDLDVKDGRVVKKKTKDLSSAWFLVPLLAYLWKSHKNEPPEEAWQLKEARHTGHHHWDSLDGIVTDSQIIDMIEDQVDYYDLIVAIARQMNKPMITKEEVKNKLIKMFRAVVERTHVKYPTGEPVKFDENQFNKAFHEFRVAPANRMVYRSA